MKKVNYVIAMVAAAALSACNNKTPQEKAQAQMEKAEDNAIDAADEANTFADTAISKNAESIIYSDIAAANAAVSKIAMPVLSNSKAKELCADIGKTIVDRINAKDGKVAEDKEKDIQKDHNAVEKAYQESKITASDRDHILQYAKDCIDAAKATIL